MVQNIYYIKFALQFADLQIHELLSEFNRQVGLRAWSSMRPYHDKALIDEFQNRGIDTSAIYDGRCISFSHHITYDIFNNKLTTLN